MYVCVLESWHVFESQRTSYGSWFSPSTLKAPGIKLGSSGLAAGAFSPEPSSLEIEAASCSSYASIKLYMMEMANCFHL